ncbi:MAG: coproporphyrinogen III oxidase, partial [Myxococcota bacterium]|nr:coproporphyrinogen III oxidase [Myxococcota bacterium]
MEQTENRLAPKYATRGPRYTSYPTAPNFVEDFDRTSAQERWRTAGADLSVYLHIPYCQVLCLFCGCHTFITTNRERGAPYVDGLLAELELVGQRTDLARSCRQLALGGGTPNFL